MVTAGILGAGTAAFLPMLGAIISSRFGPAGFGKVMGLLGPFTTLSALGTVFAAYIYDTTGSFTGAWEIFLFATIPAVTLIMFLKPKPGDENKKAKAKAAPAAGE